MYSRIQKGLKMAEELSFRNGDKLVSSKNGAGTKCISTYFSASPCPSSSSSFSLTLTSSSPFFPFLSSLLFLFSNCFPTSTLQSSLTHFCMQKWSQWGGPLFNPSCPLARVVDQILTAQFWGKKAGFLKQVQNP